MSPDLHHLSGAYAVDALDDAERESFEQHLAVCADCRAEVAELSATAQHLSSLTEATPPPALRASVLSGLSLPPRFVQLAYCWWRSLRDGSTPNRRCPGTAWTCPGAPMTRIC